MAQSQGARSVLGTVVGYVLFAVIAFIGFRLFLGTFYWMIRMAIAIVIVGGLFALYLKLKLPKDSD